MYHLPGYHNVLYTVCMFQHAYRGIYVTSAIWHFGVMVLETQDINASVYAVDIAMEIYISISSFILHLAPQIGHNFHLSNTYDCLAIILIRVAVAKDACYSKKVTY